MKNKTALSAVVLFCLTVFLSDAVANKFYLQSTKVYSPDEEVFVNLNNYYYGGNKSGSTAVQWALYRVDKPQSFFSSRILQNYQSTVPENILKDLPLLKKWSGTTQSGYYNNVSVGKLDEGVYVLEALYAGEVSQIPLFVSRYGVITRSVGSDLVAYVCESENGKAIPDFKAFAYMNDKVVEAKDYETGIACFDLATGKEDQYYSYYVPVVAFRENKVAVSQAYFYNYYYGAQSQSVKTYIFSDRPAYRPEQWAHFKGILRKRDGFSFKIPNDSITYSIIDPQNKEVAKKVVHLDANGSFHDSIFIEKTFALGEYKINAQSAGQPGYYQYWWYYNAAHGSFRVEEYKKPEYEVTVSLDKSQYVLGDVVKAEIDARYFFGAPVVNADVEYRVVREDYYVPWYYNYRYYWWYEDYYTGYYGNQTIVKQGTGKISDKGKFSIEIPTDGKDAKNFKYSVIADVRDASRRTISGSQTAIVANTEFTISAQSEKYYYSIDEKISITVSASDYTGKPVGTKLKAKLYDYKTYNKGNLLKEVDAETDPTTGMTTVSIDPSHTGYYYVEVEAIDSRKRTTTATAYAYVLKPGDYAWNWWTDNANIQILTDKKVYNAGENVKAMIYLPHETDAMVVINNNNIAHYGVYRFDNASTDGKGSFREINFKLPEMAFGKMEYYVCYMYKNQLYQRQESITVIPDEQYLSVEILFDKSQYKPGTTATAKIVVKDADGKPVPHANVALSTADESIFFMYPDNTKDIRQVFYSSDPNSYYYTYYNYFTTYSYSKPLDAQGLIWRKEKLGDVFKSDSYIDEGARYRVIYGNDEKEETILKGFVLDYETGMPLPGVRFKIGDAEFYTGQGGYFSIKGFKSSHTTAVFTYKGKTTTIENLPLSAKREITLNVAVSSKKDEKIAIVEQPVIVALDGIDDRENTEEELSFEDAGISMNGDMAVTESVALGSVAGASRAVSGKMAMAKDEAGGEMSQADKKAPGTYPVAGQKGNEGIYKEAVIRTNFQDAVYWKPNITTNGFGEASVLIKLPDNLTTWRTTARVITDDTKVGQTLAKVIVTKNLLVRMETPRFLTLGDELLIATNVHNYLNTDKTVKVSLQADGITIAGTEQTINVPAGGEQRIDWKANAQWVYKSKLTVKALTNEESDAMIKEIPVLPYGLEVFTAQSAYLIDTDKEMMTVSIPGTTDLNSVNLEINTSPSITSALLSSMDDLIGYPYGCVEQTMSRFLPNVIVANTLKNLDNGVMSSIKSTINKEELAKMVDAGCKRLKELQHTDGGWGWWNNDASHPFMTAYVFNGLHLAKKAGYPVDQQLYSNAMNALRSAIVSGKTDEPTTHAYQMMVAMNSDMKDIWQYRKKPQKEANSYEYSLWLQAAVLAGDKELQSEMLAKLESMVIKEGSIVHWGGKKFYYSWQDDEVETTANAIKALTMVKPDHELLPGAIQWLMNKRQGDSWHNTRQTAMSIYALNDIIKRELNPELDIEVYVNESLVDKFHYSPEDINKKGNTINLKGETFLVSLNPFENISKYNELKTGDNQVMIVQKGKGSCYVNAKLSYYLKGGDVEHLKESQIFSVSRTYYKLNKKSAKDGSMTYEKVKIDVIKPGDEILVKTKVTAQSPQAFLLIEDPIPAGCEFIRDTKGYVIPGETLFDESVSKGYPYYYNWNHWFTHREYRDEKLALTITQMNAGIYEYSYLLKAQIPGRYNVTPAVAQLMYYPENRGFSDFTTMEIVE